MKEKLYVIRKYIKAPSAAVAIRREKTHPVDDVWVDDEWKKQPNGLADAIGFQQV
jgi:hypothetical protein